MADQIMIDVDGFRFGTTTETGSVEWGFTLPFSEIMELRYKPTGGAVLGTLRDGTELGFRIDQVLAGEEAMRVVEALLGPEIEPNGESVDDATQGDGGLSEELQSLEDAYADAAECGGEAQVRRFVRLTVAAGFDVERFENRRQIDAIWPATTMPVSEIRWFPKSRFRLVVGRTGAFGAGEDEALDAFPKAKIVGKMDVAEADRFLDALQELLLRSHPLEKAPDTVSLIAALHNPNTPPRSDIQRPVARTPILSGEELAAALRSLGAAFEDAAECGVEPQARRFAELTAAADLKIKWSKWEPHVLDATWRDQAVFTLDWGGWPRVSWNLGSSLTSSNTNSNDISDTTLAMAKDAFSLNPDRAADALPWLRDDRHEMDTSEFNAYTDLFLDWLEVFLATHALPTREDEAIYQKELRLSKRSGRAAMLAFLTPLWVIFVVFLLLLLPGELSWGEPVGLVTQGFLFLVVPILAVVMGLAARRDLREDDSTRSRISRSAIRSAWVAIILGALISVGFVAGFGIALMKQLTGDL